MMHWSERVFSRQWNWHLVWLSRPFFWVSEAGLHAAEKMTFPGSVSTSVQNVDTIHQVNPFTVRQTQQALPWTSQQQWTKDTGFRHTIQKKRQCTRAKWRIVTRQTEETQQHMPLHQYSVSPFIRQFMLHNAVHTGTRSPGSHLWWGWGRGMLVVHGEGWGSSCIREVERAWETTLSFCLCWNLLTMVCRCYYSPVLCYLKTGRAE